MLIPLRTDVPARRAPVITQGLIITNMLIFGAMLLLQMNGTMTAEEFAGRGSAGRHEDGLYRLITYQFLHDPNSIWHLAFNMLFLWIFGCALESALGRWTFLAFYLLGGVASGAAHMGVSHAGVIGASGSVAAVAGGFIALFPRSRIQVLFFLFLIGIVIIPAAWFIGFYVAIDLLRAVRGGGNVAWMAHLGGYAAGFSAAIALLLSGRVARSQFDILFVWKQARRRQAFRHTVRKQETPWIGSQEHGQGVHKAESIAESSPSPGSVERAETPEPERVDQHTPARAMRLDITRLLRDRRLPDAAARYVAAVTEVPDLTLDEADQIDVANQLSHDGQHGAAASAYERVVATYPYARDLLSIRLLLAALYIRHLSQADRAAVHLEAVRAGTTDGDVLAMADQLASEAAAADSDSSV